MPIENGVGYGEYTRVKIEHLKIIFPMHMAITQAVIRKNQYYERAYSYLDLTAGKGNTPDGSLGSPLVFLDAVSNPKTKFDIPFRMDLVEREQSHIDELKAAISTQPAYAVASSSLYFHHGRYETEVPRLFPTKKETELGLIFVDPSGDLPNFETLAYASRFRPRMELLLYLSATNVKRQFQQTQKFLHDFLLQTGKKHRLIRKPFKGDNHQWTFLLGSNSDLFKPHKSIRTYFCLLDSPEGQDVFERINLSVDQRFELKQPPLF